MSEPFDSINPVDEVGDSGEDAGIDGVLAVQAPAGQSNQYPGIGKVANKRTPRITL